MSHEYSFFSKFKFMISLALNTYFPKLASTPKLKREIEQISSIVKLNAGTVILKEGAYVKVIPLLTKGLAKVYKEEENGNEVLLYYIKPGESCIMSITSMIKNEVSKVKAVIEEDAEIVLIPTDKAIEIGKNYPNWNDFIYELFNLKFQELLNVVKTLTFSDKKNRLLEYLREESSVKKSAFIKATHKEIAEDLGSSREVISRLLKKLENEDLIVLKQGVIELL